MQHPKVLLLSTDETESTSMQQTLSEHVVLRKVGNLLEFESELKGTNYDAVLCGWSFHKGTWNDALQQVRKRKPDLPVIIFCRSGGEQEWVEVLEAGGFDLLVSPYQKNTVLPVLEHAVASHDARQFHQVSPQNVNACELRRMMQ